jgi:PadR family transcriptional regulator PadR
VSVLLLGLLLRERPMYGYEILEQAERRSDSALRMKEGTLYPALHKMERAGLLKTEWRNNDAGRLRKYYRLTAKRRRQVRSKILQWRTISLALRLIMGRAHG